MSKELMRDLGDAFVPANPDPNKSYSQIPKHNQRFVELAPTITEERTIQLSVSSETPYQRWFGYEELDHTPEAVDLSRFKDGANVLFNHNRDDYIGIIKKAWLDKGRLYNEILFDTHELAEKIYQSVKSGIVRNVSIGYEINELKWVGERENLDVYRVVKWTPLETSIVTVPADATVGFGRQYFNLSASKDKTLNWEKLEERITKSVIKNFVTELTMAEEIQGTVLETKEPNINLERDRAEAIYAAGNKYNCAELAQKALKEGWSVEQLRSQILLDQPSQKPIARSTDVLGLSEGEQKRYSLQNAIKAALDKGFSEPCLEKEVHEELVKRASKTRGYEENGNVLLPINDLSVSRAEAIDGYNELARTAALKNHLNSIYQRDQMVGDPLLGGNLVETELLAERFVDIFRNRSIMRQMGMQMLPGLVGNIDIPKQTAGAIDGNSVYWIPEDADVGQINAQFGLVKFRPKNVGSYMYVTRSMLLHSSIGMDNFIRRELAIALALGIDKAAIEGTGTNDQPLGILNTPGVNPIIFGVNGGLPTWERLIQFETKVAVANADERTMGWIMNPKTRGELKSRQKFAGTTGETLWQNATAGSNQGYVNGYRVGVSNQIRGNYTKGTGTQLSAAVFGDYSSLVCAEWGEYELAADPYHKFLAGGVRVRIIKTCDMAVLQEKAFSVATDLSTPFSNA